MKLKNINKWLKKIGIVLIIEINKNDPGYETKIYFERYKSFLATPEKYRREYL